MVMERLLFLFLFLSLHFFFLLTSCSLSYDPPSPFFINCGSASNFSLDDGRNFTGDLNSVSSGDPLTNPNSSSSLSLLYQSARVFPKQSPYHFHIHTQGIFCLRLHFYPFNSPQLNLENALFDAFTSGFSLLSDFSVPISNAPQIKEFFLTINHTDFILQFAPSRSNSFAFVSAIELFLLPQDFVEDRINHTLTKSNFFGVRSQVLQTIHRLNIGGQQNQDPLWRNWVTDDQYLISKALAKTCLFYNGTLGYGALGAGPFSASDLVYRTCRELNSTHTSESNITWEFPVTKNARNLVRFHFCNIVSTTPDMPIFNLYIYDFTQTINTSQGVSTTISHFAAPFYYDFVVDSNDLGSLKVSVGSMADSQVNNAYLNGLEIMEFSHNLNFVQHSTSSKKFVFIIIGSVVGFIFLLLLVAAVLFFLMKRKRREKQPTTTDLWSSRPSTYSDRTSQRSRMPYMSPVPNLNLHLNISLKEILDATDNFNPKLLIGEGGFGKVYKGTLENGMKVAVKRSDPEHGQGIPEFETEILVLSKIRHRHLVSLIGYCDDMSEMILVYEFMEKGTLRDHLHGSNSNLTWTQRLEICIGAGKGLQYLHSGIDGGIIHRDVKSTNILLDENFVAKVADFGLSTAGPPDPDHYSVGIKGSFGYLDPEYFKTFQFTEKSDVYAFGVVLLEVLCGRPAIVNSERAEEVSLAEWGMVWQRKGELEKIIDAELVGKIKSGSLRKFGETVERCLSKKGEERPKMKEVVWDIEYAAMLEKRGVEKKREPHEDSISNTKNSMQFSSINVERLPSFESSVLIGRKGSEGEEAGEGDSAVFPLIGRRQENR